MRTQTLSGYILTSFIFILFGGCGGELTDRHHTVSAADSLFHTTDSLPKFKLLEPDSLFIVRYLQSEQSANKYADQILKFYSERHFKCVWFNENGVSEHAPNIMNMIDDYLQTGLIDSTIYLSDLLVIMDTLMSEGFTPLHHEELIRRADVMLTSQFFIFSSVAWKGSQQDKLKDLGWFLPENKIDAVSYLDSLLFAPKFSVERKEPVYRQFSLLKDKLRIYDAIRNNGGWISLPEINFTLEKGDTSFIVPLVKARLFSVDSIASTDSTTLYDDSLETRVKDYQETTGLTANGKIDLKLIRELNIPIEQRIKTMMLNLERWKWIPADPGNDFIAVNIPEFKLHVFENGKSVWSMNVIVGKAVNQTVIFSGNLSTIVFSPYWVIPRSILEKETLPAIRKNRSYLSKNNMEVVTATNPPKVIASSSIDWSKYSGSNFPYIIRQKPGKNNSLGNVKFLFPNSFSIYMHDTPAKNLFSEGERDFSHGCIRLQEPEKLAEYLLRNDTTWTPQKIKSAMNKGTEQYVTLKTKLPVYITYFTSWVDKNGRLNFRNDVYGHDKKLALLLLR